MGRQVQWTRESKVKFVREALRLTVKEQAAIYGLTENTIQTYRVQFRKDLTVPQIESKRSSTPKPAPGLLAQASSHSPDLNNLYRRAQAQVSALTTENQILRQKLTTIRAAVTD